MEGYVAQKGRAYWAERAGTVMVGGACRHREATADAQRKVTAIFDSARALRRRYEHRRARPHTGCQVTSISRVVPRRIAYAKALPARQLAGGSPGGWRFHESSTRSCGLPGTRAFLVPDPVEGAQRRLSPSGA